MGPLYTHPLDPYLSTCPVGDLVSFFTDVVKPKTSKSESPRTRIRAFSEQKTPSPLSSDAHKSLGKLMVPSNWRFCLSSTPFSISLPPIVPLLRHFFLLSSPCLSFSPPPLLFSFPPFLPLPASSSSILSSLSPSSLIASATNPRSHSPVDFYDPPDRETMRLQKFGKLLAGPNTDLGKSRQSH